MEELNLKFVDPLVHANISQRVQIIETLVELRDLSIAHLLTL